MPRWGTSDSWLKPGKMKDKFGQGWGSQGWGERPSPFPQDPNKPEKPPGEWLGGATVDSWGAKPDTNNTFPPTSPEDRMDWDPNSPWNQPAPTTSTTPTSPTTPTTPSPWETGNYDPRTQGEWTPQGGWGAMGYDPNFRFDNPDTLTDEQRSTMTYMNWVHAMLPYLLPEARVQAIAALQGQPDFLTLPEDQRAYLNSLADRATQFGVGQWSGDTSLYDQRARLEAINRANTAYWTGEGGTNTAGQPVGAGEWDSEGRRISNLMNQLLSSYGQGNMSRRGRNAYYGSIKSASGLLPEDYQDVLSALLTPSYNTAQYVSPSGSMGLLRGTTNRGYSQANPWG